jgi:TolA-binding protein
MNSGYDLRKIPGTLIAGKARGWKGCDHCTLGELLKSYLTILDIEQDSRFPWVWIYTFTAVVLGMAVGVFAWLAVQSRNEAGLGRTANAPPASMRQIPAERIAVLAQFEPPEYEASAESVKGSPEFQAAMEHYRKGDYAGAAVGLRGVALASASSVEARFYLAICLLLTNDRPAAIQELQAVIAAGDTPYLEPARFYLAKALLADRNIRGADIQLRVVVEMHGKLEKQAQVLQAQIVP